VHRFPEEDDALDVLDGPTESLAVEALPDVADSVLVRVRDSGRVVVDGVAVAKADEPRLPELKPEGGAVDLLQEPEVPFLEEVVGRVRDAWNRGGTSSCGSSVSTLWDRALRSRMKCTLSARRLPGGELLLSSVRRPVDHLHVVDPFEMIDVGRQDGKLVCPCSGRDADPTELTYRSACWFNCSSANVRASLADIDGKTSSDRIFLPSRYTSMWTPSS